MNRPKNNKIRRPQFLCIVGCEGKNQERIYFDKVAELVNCVEERTHDLVFDYDGKKDKYEEAIDLAIENKIELGYTNYCFDLWLILHKEDYFDIVQNQDAYADKLRQVFGLAADANIKKEKRVTEIVNQIGLSDIKNAIQRGKKISEDNQGKEANKTPKENRYYDNPDTQMHVLLQFLFAKVGINIDALG